MSCGVLIELDGGCAHDLSLHDSETPVRTRVSDVCPNECGGHGGCAAAVVDVSFIGAAAGGSGDGGAVTLGGDACVDDGGLLLAGTGWVELEVGYSHCRHSDTAICCTPFNFVRCLNRKRRAGVNRLTALALAKVGGSYAHGGSLTVSMWLLKPPVEVRLPAAHRNHREVLFLHPAAEYGGDSVEMYLRRSEQPLVVLLICSHPLPLWAIPLILSFRPAPPFALLLSPLFSSFLLSLLSWSSRGQCCQHAMAPSPLWC